MVKKYENLRLSEFNAGNNQVMSRISKKFESDSIWCIPMLHDCIEAIHKGKEHMHDIDALQLPNLFMR